MESDQPKTEPVIDPHWIRERASGKWLIETPGQKPPYAWLADPMHATTYTQEQAITKAKALGFGRDTHQITNKKAP